MILYISTIALFIQTTYTSSYFSAPLSFHQYNYSTGMNPLLENISFLNPTFEFCLGTPKQCVQATIDTGTSFSWFMGSELSHIFNHTFHYNESSSITVLPGVMSVLIEGGVCLGSYAKDIPSPIENIDDVDSKFVFGLMTQSDIDKRVLNKDASIGVMKNISQHYRHREETTSYLEYLKHNNIIDKRVFSIEIEKEFKGGEIVFGEKNYKAQIDFCSSKDEEFQFSWVCSLKNVIYKNESLSAAKDEKVFFDTQNRLITAPYESGNYIFKKIIENYKAECQIMEDATYNYITCNKGFDISKIEKLKLEIGRIIMNINLSSLFVYKEQEQIYISLLVLTKHDRNHWSIGLPLFENKVFVFDLDNQRVGMIDKAIVIKGTKGIFKVLGVIIIIIILVIGFLFLRRRYVLSKSKESKIDFDLMKEDDNN